MKTATLIVVLLTITTAVAQVNSGGMLDGIVVDATNARIGRACVVIHGSDIRPLQAYTGEDGRFSIALQPGSYDIDVSHAGFEPLKRTVVIESGRTTELTIELEIGGKLNIDSFVGPPPVVPTTPSEVVDNVIPEAHGAAPVEVSPNKACSQEDVAKYGHPVMFSPVNGVAFGVSTERKKFQKGEPITMAVWLSNKSRRDVQTGGCSFLEDNIAVFDSTGRRLLSQAEQDEFTIRREGRQSIRVCSESLPLMNRHPGFCGVVGGGILNREYNLLPGTYTVREKKAVSTTTISDDQPDAHSLNITVE